MKEFAGRYEDWRVILVGDGPERSRLLEFVKSCPGWEERVRFLGRRSDVPELLNAMDVYVLPSLSESLHCNSLLEAMAAGLPVIASSTGGKPEVAVDRYPTSCSRSATRPGSRNTCLPCARNLICATVWAAGPPASPGSSRSTRW